jgi:biotin carboxyl carrier protein
MKYFARVNDKVRKVEVEKVGNTYVVTIDEEPFVVDARLIDGPSAMSLIVNKKCYEILVTDSGRSKLVSTGGDEFEVRLEDELAHLRSGPAHHRAEPGGEEVKAPMPGVVVSVEAQVGQEVSAGSPLVIVEAMKMQNEISSAGGGKIKQILVKPGDVVETQQTLAVIDGS